MNMEKEPKYGDESMQWHPEHKRDERAIWIGYYRHYSQWEFLSDGLVVLGPPLKKI